MKKKTILIIDDISDIRTVYTNVLQDAGYKVKTAEHAEKALEIITEIIPDLVLTDMRLPGIDGIEFIKKIHNLDDTLPIILITAYGSSSAAIRAMKEGAYDYLTKPVDHYKLTLVVKKALEQKELVSKYENLKQEVEAKYGLDEMVGKSQVMQKLFKLIGSVCSSSANVLIQGECGTGKELVARAIHYNSPRRENPLEVVDCSALPENLLVSELFGYEKGAFTGALKRKKGRVELAHTGTLFLDEIGEMDLTCQAKLLRPIEKKPFVRLGGHEPIVVDFRLITATNRDLKQEVAAERFREDLFFRLNVITITVPPLRERKEDIPLLVGAFLQKICKREKIRTRTLSPGALECLLQYDWPGNVRELENCMERAVVVCPANVITREYLADDIGSHYQPEAGTDTLQNTFDLEVIINKTIRRALAECKGNKAAAAKLLKIGRKRLYTLLKNLSGS